MFIKLPQVPRHFIKIGLAVLISGLVIIGGILARSVYLERQRSSLREISAALIKTQLSQELSSVPAQLKATSDELATLKAEDQYVKNTKLEADIKSIQTTFQDAVTSYSELITLRGNGAKTQPLEVEFALVLSQLSKRDYTSAKVTLQKLTIDIETLKTLLAASDVIPVDVTPSNTPPAAGYSRQVVDSDAGQFVVDILAADLNSTRVSVETASSGDCENNCPVAALADYVGRSGGYAGINGPYFCPAEYPDCAGKTNSFDTLIMNKNKFYFNSVHNEGSSVPALVFSGSEARLSSSADAGRDENVEAVIAAQPALISSGQVAFGGDGDPKKGSRGSRSFIAVKGSTVYIGVVRLATVAEVARVLKTLGMDSALNLDSGGSTAFLVNGKYVAGPGRQTPFGIVLVKR